MMIRPTWMVKKTEATNQAAGAIGILTLSHGHQ